MCQETSKPMWEAIQPAHLHPLWKKQVATVLQLADISVGNQLHLLPTQGPLQQVVLFPALCFKKHSKPFPRHKQQAWQGKWVSEQLFCVSHNMVAWTAMQFGLPDLPKCFENVFVLTTQKSAEHSLVLKIDIHCVCWWEHSEFVCSFSTHSYQISFEGAGWENCEVSKAVLHAETEKTMPRISLLEKPVRLLILMLQMLHKRGRTKINYCYI